MTDSATIDSATIAPAGTWKVDPAHSRFGFAVKHMGVATVRGHFEEVDGTLVIGDDPSAAKITGSAKTASVQTGVGQRDDHLRSADFFDAENHPELTFESTRIEAIDDETYKIVGDLTIHGETREIELEAEVGGVEVGMNDEDRVGIEATGTLSRSDFNMKFNAALGSGNAVVADKVKLVLDISAIREA
jgi:polyisoprenoid-binding protein YceI